MRDYLVYELHLTNFLAAEMTIQAIDVIEGGAGEALLARLDPAALVRNAKHVGSRPESANSLVLGAGRRAVMFLWVPAPNERTAPTSLRHRIELGIAGRTDRYLVETSPQAVATQAPVMIAPPLRGGPWVAGNAPQPDAVPAHNQLFYPRDGHILTPQRFATDWVKLNGQGCLYSGAVGRNSNWATDNEPVLAVADGTVVATVTDVVENVPPEVNTPMTRQTVAGNYVVLDISGGRFAFYGHLKTGSVAVRPGDRVRTGQVIARVGNSGNSTGPHLHFHITDRAEVGQGEGLPFVFARHRHLGRLSVTLDEMDAGAEWRRSTQPEDRVADLPGNSSVVEFP